MSTYHTTVLLKETIQLLNIKLNTQYIDATLGGGGHAQEIIKHGGNVFAIDADQEAINYAKANYITEIANNKLKLYKGNFSNLKHIAAKENLKNISGILFDLGVSGHQFDSAERGFSYQHNGPLDMRMDTGLAVKAVDLVNALSKNDLSELFTRYGEEGYSRIIANAITKSRQSGLIDSTNQLMEIIQKAVPRAKNQKDIAARVFQSLRIAVNDELNNLKIALPQAFRLIETNGRLAVISFHSLEDRIVKKLFLQWQNQKKGIIITRKPVKPSEEEIMSNRRSRSAKLRVIQKTKL